MKDCKIVLGDGYEDKVTGFRGTATARCVHLGGKTEIKLTPRVDAAGVACEALWVDVKRIIPCSGDTIGFTARNGDQCKGDLPK